MQLSLDLIRKNFEEYLFEVESEILQNRSGQKPTLNTQPIIDKYSWLGNQETIVFLAEKMKNAENPDSISRLYFASIGMNLDLYTAHLEDQLHTYLANAKIQIDRLTQIPYHNLLRFLKQEPDFDRRLRAFYASYSIIEKAREIQKEILRTQAFHIHEQTKLSYMEYYAKKKQTRYERFTESLMKVIEELKPTYLQIMNRLSQKKLGKSFQNLHCCHRHFITQEDNISFSFNRILPLIKKIYSQRGIDYTMNGCIQIDDKDLPGKNPRACCFSLRIPGMTRILLKPNNDLSSIETALHELGHGLHHENTSSALPFEMRYLPHSNAFTETCAYIEENLLRDPKCLVHYLGLPKKQANHYSQLVLRTNLMMLFRYIGKLKSEYLYFSKGNWDDSSMYEKHMTQITGFIYPKSLLWNDLDPCLYTADYLRAWVAHAQISHYLDQTYGEEWFLNDKATPFFKKMWGLGATTHIDDFCQKLGYEPYDTSYLIKRFEILK